MDWVVTYISGPIRNFYGLLSSIYPFALMEVLLTAGGIFLIYYIIKSIRDTSRRRGRWKLLGKKLLPILVIACYLWGAFCWLWNSGYHGASFAEKNGLVSYGVETSDLIAVTEFFAENINELSLLMERDEDGYIIFDRREVFAASRDVYKNISEDFPSLGGTLYPPKPMLYSWLMSVTGYSGMYFALTGEAMINTDPPGVYIPVTVAHEHAHQLGVFAEDEANFVGILACVTSDNLAFEYAGYMSGYNYLSNALYMADYDAWLRIWNELTDEVKLDRAQTSDFWASTNISNTRIEFLDNILSALMRTTRSTVNTVYDEFLKSNDQELGIMSYGACVDLLVLYFNEQN
ncbi:MAG: DUF3810 domain-containing protein [Oscillospiraceae bacterium]|nr:DUF3810 domain-containing protein [Oscillospiraceae bacterium]